MLDFDLAQLYAVTTSALNQSVKRNLKRFPVDFMFQLTPEEYTNLKSQFVISKVGGTTYMPFAFTEQGLAMLSSVLKNETAIKVNILNCLFFRKFRFFETTAQLAFSAYAEKCY